MLTVLRHAVVLIIAIFLTIYENWFSAYDQLWPIKIWRQIMIDCQEAE